MYCGVAEPTFCSEKYIYVNHSYSMMLKCCESIEWLYSPIKFTTYAQLMIIKDSYIVADTFYSYTFITWCGPFWVLKQVPLHKYIPYICFHLQTMTCMPAIFLRQLCSTILWVLHIQQIIGLRNHQLKECACI